MRLVGWPVTSKRPSVRPDFFRDPDGNTRKLLREMKEFLKQEEQAEAMVKSAGAEE